MLNKTNKLTHPNRTHEQIKIYKSPYFSTLNHHQTNKNKNISTTLQMLSSTKYSPSAHNAQQISKGRSRKVYKRVNRFQLQLSSVYGNKITVDNHQKDGKSLQKNLFPQDKSKQQKGARMNAKDILFQGSKTARDKFELNYQLIKKYANKKIQSTFEKKSEFRSKTKSINVLSKGIEAERIINKKVSVGEQKSKVIVKQEKDIKESDWLYNELVQNLVYNLYDDDF